MTNLKRIETLTTKIRNLILAETEAALDTAAAPLPNDPLDEMWIGVARIESALTRARTNERSVG